MVLRCSLFGHDFGEPEVEREREERGSEVVVVTREYEVCARCGEVSVISESTEVTSLVGEESQASPADEPAPAVDPGGVELEGTDTPTTEDAEILDAGADEPLGGGEPVDAVEEGVTAGAPPVTAGSVGTSVADDGEDPISDDAEILEADDDRTDDRAPGEWPDSDDVGPPEGVANEPASWPDVDPADDEPLDGAETLDAAVEPTDDAVLVDADVRPDPESTVTDSGTGIASAGAAPTPSESQQADPVSAEYFCPRCSFVAPATHGSLRPGDICPDCRRGYLGERDLE